MNEQQLYLESLYMALPQAGPGDHNETAAYYLAWICAYMWNVIASFYLNYGYMNRTPMYGLRCRKSAMPSWHKDVTSYVILK